MFFSIFLQSVPVYGDSVSQFCGLTQNLSLNQKKIEVFYLKNILIEKGYLTGTSTNVYDKSLFNTVKKFQKNNKLSQTGNLGPQTLKKMKSLWCKTGAQSVEAKSVNTSNQTVENLSNKSITIEAGRLIRLQDNKLCNFGAGKVDWGWGGISVIGPNMDELSCKEGLYHLYANDGEYKIKVFDANDRLRFETQAKLLGSKQSNVSIDEFYSKQDHKDSNAFIWKTTNAESCVMTDNKAFRETVQASGMKNLISSQGSIYELRCKDYSGRESVAYEVAGGEKLNKNFLIKQFGYLTNNSKVYLVWQTTSNTKNCVIENHPFTPNNGAVEFLSTYGAAELQCFSYDGTQETKKVYIGSEARSSTPRINYFEYKVLGDDVTFRWDTGSVGSCALFGDLFGIVGKLVPNGEGSLKMYLPNNLSKVRLQCSNGSGYDVKEVEVRKAR